MMEPQFKVGQQVKLTVGIDETLPEGSIGDVLQVIEVFEGYHVDFGRWGQWNVYENELEAMESE